MCGVAQFFQGLRPLVYFLQKIVKKLRHKK
jgi:hypothetical protein